MKNNFFVLFIFSLATVFSCSQDNPKNKYKFFDKRPNKGKIFVSFGWNASVFSNSNIHFSGTNYDFTLENVKATDRQSPFSFELYFGPATITIPQYNFKIGYFFHNNFYVSLNADHMK